MTKTRGQSNVAMAASHPSSPWGIGGLIEYNVPWAPKSLHFKQDLDQFARLLRPNYEVLKNV